MLTSYGATMHMHKTPALAAFALGEAILPIGFLPSGRPVFPIAGGAPDDDDAKTDDATDDDDAKTDDATDDDDAKKADEFKPISSQDEFDRRLSDRLRREREKFADYGDLKKKAEAHDAAREAAKSDADKAIDAARSDGEKAALERVNARLVKSEARVLASAAKFRDPSDAVAFLDLAKVTVGDDGEVDEAAITEQLKALAESKPYLVDDGKRPAPKSDKSQGGGTADDKPSLDRGRAMYEQRRTKKTA